MIDWSEVLEEIKGDLCKRTGKPFAKSGDLLGASDIEIIDFDIIKVKNDNEVLIVETPGFVTATWHPQPVSLMGRIKRSLGRIPVTLNHIEAEDNMAIYRIY